MLDPAGLSPGGSRRYSRRDLARLRRILELRDVMGFDLERINIILHAEDRLAELRDEVHAGVSSERYRAAVEEAITINNGMRAQVEAKLASGWIASEGRPGARKGLAYRSWSPGRTRLGAEVATEAGEQRWRKHVRLIATDRPRALATGAEPA